MSAHKAPRPVGRGYMPKGGVKAAQAQNARWQESVARRAAETAQSHADPIEVPEPAPLADDGRTGARGSGCSAGRRSLSDVPGRHRIIVTAVLLVGTTLLLMLLASVSAYAAVDCAVTPEDPSCVTPPPDPSPSPTPTATETSSPVPPAPGQDTGVYLDPATGSLRVDENTGVAVGVAFWLAAVVAGLATAWLVLP